MTGLLSRFLSPSPHRRRGSVSNSVCCWALIMKFITATDRSVTRLRIPVKNQSLAGSEWVKFTKVSLLLSETVASFGIRRYQRGDFSHWEDDTLSDLGFAWCLSALIKRKESISG